MDVIVHSIPNYQGLKPQAIGLKPQVIGLIPQGIPPYIIELKRQAIGLKLKAD
jgi:hypothetical protein